MGSKSMPKKRKKKKGIAILGAIVAGVTVLVGIGASAGKRTERVIPRLVQPPVKRIIEPPTVPPMDSRIQDCIDAGGSWIEQFQVCEFPDKPPEEQFLSSDSCGLLSQNFVKTVRGGGFYVVNFRQKANFPEGAVQWTMKRGEIGDRVVIFGADFNLSLRNWLQCRVTAGEIP